MEHKVFRLNIKGVDDSGHFTGYAAVFGNVDAFDDSILPGAMKEFDDNGEGQVRVLNAHNDASWPLGTATLAQDATGIAFDGRLLMEDPDGARMLLHLRKKTITGVSIGYTVLPDGAEFRDGVRLLKALKIWEISLVIFPANELARVTSVKSMQLREYETLLRERLGVSRAEAKALAASGLDGLKVTRERADVPDLSAMVSVVADARDRLKFTN
jgi:uncharacterized protein